MSESHDENFRLALDRLMDVIESVAWDPIDAVNRITNIKVSVSDAVWNNRTDDAL